MTKANFWSSVLASQEIEVEHRSLEPWTLYEKAFEDWQPRSIQVRPIPRRIHQIWLGSPLPKLYARWGETWRKHHPDWEYRLWSEEDIANLGLQNQRSYDLSPNFGVKSDIARYEILERYGGIYADTDFECLSSFETLAQSTSFFAGIMYGGTAPIANGLIGCVPGHPIMKELMERLKEPFAGQDGMQILAYSGPTQFSARCQEFLETHPREMVLLPPTYFYAFPNQHLDSKKLDEVRRWARPESLAIHYWEVSWKKDPWTTRLYWWMKRHLPARLVALVYRLLKGKKASD